MTKNPRCATAAIDSLMAGWKQEPSPYDDPAYQVPTCQRAKLIPEQPKKEIRCATPAIDEVLKQQSEYDQRITAGESEADILKSWQEMRR